MQVLITGSAGFIGYHLAKALARQGIATYGIDSINSYYDVSLKKARLKACGIDLSRQEQEYRSISLFYFLYQNELYDNLLYQSPNNLFVYSPDVMVSHSFVWFFLLIFLLASKAFQ